jgi:hypothetical protein
MNLLIVNAGPNAISPPPQASLRRMAIYWHPQSNIDADMAWWERDKNRRKFQSVAHMLTNPGELSGKYDAIGLVDDDLVPEGCSWGDIFSLFLRTGLEVAQPALHPRSGSNYSHPITQQVAGVTWRRTNFVEVMCPLFTTPAFLSLLPFFDDAGRASWGLEAMWSSRFRCGILDATPVWHTKPVGGDVYKFDPPVDFGEEADRFRAKYGVKHPDEATLEVHR